VNVVGTQQLLGAASDTVPEATILLISSGDVYGAAELNLLPHTEESPLHPLSPYAASKIEAERVGLEAARHGQTVIIARPFNHIGVGQSNDFLVPGLIARFRDALQRGEDSIPVGDLSVSRDFTDVRDVVRAYRLLVEDGASGEIYNVASGKLVGVAAVAQLIQQRVAPTVTMREDPSFLRASENPYSCGSAEKLRLTTGWEPRISLESSLDVLTSH
jgi:GDP-4-dehydro-6-deoxy-D-mannose reductase